MKKEIDKLKQEFLAKLAQVSDEKELRDLELEFLSRKGKLSKLLRGLKDLSLEQRRKYGQLANKLKLELQEEFAKTSQKINLNNFESSDTDISFPGIKLPRGHFNPITLVQDELEDLFRSLGFMILDGPQLESDYFNFTALNMPATHPARDMQDTFYINKTNKKGEYDLLMRTQTSPMQIRAIRRYGAPLRALIPGRCFRNEATDARHEHTFYQMEGLLVDKGINFSHLKSFLEIVGQRLFGPETKLRMRPKFFPFVEPGNNGEYTCFLCHGKGCRVCKYTGWLEILGAGLIHPEVLREAGLDPKIYSGLAFGFGLNRLAMLKYGINDIRLFNSGDLKFLEQF